MADQELLEHLLTTLREPGGRKDWLARKLRVRVVDLASADLTNQALRDYDFSDANLSTAIFLGADLTGADLSDAELSWADLRRATLRNCCLDRANLSSANLQGANLADACMEEVILTGARLAEADLIGADLSSADLSGADLRGASLKYALLSGARLDGADVAEADLTGSVMDDDAPDRLLNFDQAIIDDRKYRKMKSRISRLPPEEEETREPDAEEKKREAEARSPAPKELSPAEAGRQEGKTKAEPRKRWRAKSKRGGRRGRAPSIDYVASQNDLETQSGWYRILGVEPGAPLAGITQSFRQKAKLYHPDKTLQRSPEDQGAAHEQFLLIRQAYENLTRMKAKPLLHVHWVAEVPVRESAYDYTIEEYLLLARVNSEHCDLLFNLAWKYFDHGKLDESIAVYERVLGLRPQDYDAEYNLRVVKLCKTFDIQLETAVEVPLDEAAN